MPIVWGLLPLLNMIYWPPMSPSPLPLPQALSNRPPSIVQSPAPTHRYIGYVLVAKAIPRDAPSPQRVHSRAEPFLQGRPIVSIILMSEKGQPPIRLAQSITQEILPHFFNLTLNPGTLPQRLPSVRDPQTPSAYPTWYQFCLIDDYRCSTISAPLPIQSSIYRASPASIGRVDQAPFPSTPL